jgi:AcrR family transcriptional regulator
MSAGQSWSDNSVAGRPGHRPSMAPTRRGRRARGGARRATELQRKRLLHAVVAVASEGGYEGVSVTAVVARAGVSRKTFYELFEGRDDCFLAAVEDSVAHMVAAVAPAYEERGSWSERLRAGLVALLAFLERERETGALALSYMVGYGPSSPELRARVLGRLRSVVEAGRSRARSHDELSPLAAELVVAGVLAVIHARLQTGPRRMSALVNPLMWMIVLPHRGPAAAARELTRAAPERATPAMLESDPLRDLHTRVTYRTAKVLEVIAVVPAASNAEIGASAGVTDQGQISKLLARLSRLGLIENTGVGRPGGGANAWHLTPTGRELESAIRGESDTARHPKRRK